MPRARHLTWTAAAFAAGLALMPGAGCSHVDPPTPAGVPWVATPEGQPPGATSVTATATASAAPVDASAALAPPDAGSSNASASLPQTTERPAPSSPELSERIGLLWTAIVNDEPDTAMPAFFPLAAYQQVKDVGDPAADWKRRLVSAYRHDVHALHTAVAEAGGDAQLVSFDVPDARARWVDPGEEWNKIGYFRVFGSRLRYTAGGSDHAIEVKSLISWRGQWYVVHLSAIR